MYFIKKSKPSQVLLLLIFIMLGLKTYNMLLTMQLYFDATYYLTLKSQIDTLKKENILLEDEYLELASYQHIMNEARKEGYIGATYIIF